MENYSGVILSGFVSWCDSVAVRRKAQKTETEFLNPETREMERDSLSPCVPIRGCPVCWVAQVLTPFRTELRVDCFSFPFPFSGLSKPKSDSALPF